jgi:hypothetical protein
MIGSLTILPFPVAVAVAATEPTAEPIAEPATAEPPTADALEPPPAADAFEPVTDVLADVKAVYILPPLPRTDDLAHQELQLIAIGAIVVGTVLCSVLLHALLARA